MDMSELGIQLDIETAHFAKLESELDTAECAWRLELERDCERKDGSMRQETLRDVNRENLQTKVSEAKAALDAQDKVIAGIKQKISIPEPSKENSASLDQRECL